MVAVAHVAGLAGRCPLAVFALDLPDRAVLRRGPHLPLGMVEAHVAGHAGPRVQRLGFLERVPCVARVALGMAVTDLGFLCIGFGTDLVAARAALVAFAGHGLRLVSHHRHGA
jgi:hypothetical protein